MIVLYPRLNKEGLPFYRALLFLLILMSAFRFNVGVDTYSYTKEYDTFPNLHQLTYSFIQESRYKILWIIFESTLRSITSSFYLLQVILAIFVNYVVFKTIRNYSLHPFLAVLFYFLFFYFNLNMEILRESIPMCLLLIGIDLLQKRKYISYSIIAVIAFFFHESGVVLFVLPFIFYLNINKKIYFITIIVVFLISNIISIYFAEIIKNLNFLFMEQKLAYYETVSRSAGTELWVYIKYVIFPSIIFFVTFKKLTDFEKKAIFLYIICSILYTQIFGFFRIRDYFLLAFLISISNIFVRGFGNLVYNNLFRLVFIFTFLFIFLFRYYYSDTSRFNLYQNYYPYNSIFDEQIPSSRLNYIKYLGK